MPTIPNTCPDFVEHPHILPTGENCYQCRKSYASVEQGTSAMAVALFRKRGMFEVDVHQTGGFTMCVYIPTFDKGSYIYANAEGATYYSGKEFPEDDFESEDLIYFEENQTPEEKAEALYSIIIEKNLLSSLCSACGMYFEKSESDEKGFHSLFFCEVA